MCLSCELMEAHAVSQTAGGSGDVHLRRSLLTTSINHQSNIVFMRRHLLISPQELTQDDRIFLVRTRAKVYTCLTQSKSGIWCY